MKDCKRKLVGFIYLHESLLYVSIVFDRQLITIGTTCELCQFILLYFGYSASSALDASESKAMNPIENRKYKLSEINIRSE